MELTRDQIEMAIWRKCLTIMALLFCAQVAFATPLLIIPRHTCIRLYQIPKQRMPFQHSIPRTYFTGPNTFSGSTNLTMLTFSANAF